MYMGLDIGTSGVKAALVDRLGNVISQYQVSYSFSDTEDGRRELNPEQVYLSAIECIARASHGYEVRSITVSSLGEAITLCDNLGKFLCPSILGTDIRGSELCLELIEKLDINSFTKITGLNSSTIYSLSKLLWLKKHKKELFDKTKAIFTFQDLLIYKMSGIRQIDYSMASRTGLFDCNKYTWSDKILEAAEIPKELFSTPVRGGTIVGKILPSIASELKLSKETLIVVGTHDHICNAIGSGVVKKGLCANTVGTTEGLTAILSNDVVAMGNIQLQNIACEPFVLDNTFNTVAWENTSGVLLKWFVSEFVNEKTTNLNDIFDWMNKDLPPEPTGILVLPHFSGAATPYMDEHSRGAILGLTLDTKRIDIYKAIIEGTNYELRLIMNSIIDSGVAIEKIVATGGALSPQLLQIKSDILGKEIYTVKNKQTGTIGGAMLGAVAVGEFNNLESAANTMVKKGLTYYPNTAKNKMYSEYFNCYKRLYPAVKSVFK